MSKLVLFESCNTHNLMGLSPLICLGCDLPEGLNLPWGGRGSPCKAAGLFTLEIGLVAMLPASEVYMTGRSTLGFPLMNLLWKEKVRQSVIEFAGVSWLTTTNWSQRRSGGMTICWLIVLYVPFVLFSCFLLLVYDFYSLM